MNEMGINCVDGNNCKRCPKCEKWMPIDNFQKDKKTKDGLYSKCKDCKNKIQKERTC